MTLNWNFTVIYCFSLFDLSNKLRSIFTSHSDSSSSENNLKCLEAILYVARKPTLYLTSPLEYKCMIFVLVLGVICTRRSAVR